MLYYLTQTFMIIILNQGYKKRSLKNIQVKIKHLCSIEKNHLLQSWASEMGSLFI